MRYNKGFSKIVIVAIVAAALIAAGVVYYVMVVKNPKIIWDGTYRMTDSLSCTGNVPKMPSSIPINENVLVVNNAVVDTAGNFGAAGKIYPLDKQYQVTLTLAQFNKSQGGATQNVNGQMKFQFYKDGEALKTRGNYTTDITIAKEGKNYSAHCAGDVLGVRL